MKKEKEEKHKELKYDEWGLPIDEVTMSANVAPPQVIVPLGMVKAGRPTPVLAKKKKKS